MRAKWSAPIRKYWKISEQMMVKYCDLAICDSVNAINAALRQKKYALETELEDEREKNRKLIAQIRRDYENSSKPSSLSPNHKKIKRGGCEDYISAESLVERIHGLPVKSIEFITEEDQRKDA